MQLPANADRLYVEHFVANERAGAFYEHEGFAVERIDSSPTEDPAVVWRVSSNRRPDKRDAGKPARMRIVLRDLRGCVSVGL